jgi:hypothetical protein
LWTKSHGVLFLIGYELSAVMKGASRTDSLNLWTVNKTIETPPCSSCIQFWNFFIIPYWPVNGKANVFPVEEKNSV